MTHPSVFEHQARWKYQTARTLLVPFLALFLLPATRLSAQPVHRFSLQSVSGLHNTDTIYTTRPITFYLRLTSLTGSTKVTTDLWNYFRVYSPSGAEWSATTGGLTEEAYLLDHSFLDIRDSNGVAPDTIGFYANGCGLPPDFDTTALYITIGPIDTAYAGGSICLDSMRVGLWRLTVGWCDVSPEYRNPDWEGPYCFTLVNPPCAIGLTGDANADASLSTADVILMVNYVFKSGAPPAPCAAVSDVNCSGSATSADIVYLVNHVFKSGPAPCDVCGLIWNGTTLCP